ncbi:MAG: phosphoribosylaminoimidazole carboxylase ade2 [Piccolia ochrophora]|nr:MAG: phosphoribosylaminoimidazole carboxylase ade2 [Piccolia ochrophora]
MDERVVGILGGGQLGRMLVEAAHRLNVKIVILDAPKAPAKQINAVHPHINGSFADPDSIHELARQCDILTVEIEHVNTEALEDVATNGVEVGIDGSTQRRRVQVHPSWRTIRIIQDKFLQKEHLKSRGIPTADSIPLNANTVEELTAVVLRLGLPCMLKSRTQAYDGRGNFEIRDSADVTSGLNALEARPLYAEKWAQFKLELAVMVVKTADDASGDDTDSWERNTMAYPTVETIHQDSICKLVYAPARGLANTVAYQAQVLARRAVASFWGKGIFGVEMFLLEDDSLLINEIAPRPHNSGHYSIEACAISQYDAHLRAILGLPFPSSSSTQRRDPRPAVALRTHDTYAVMLNILGGVKPDSHLSASRIALETTGATLHLYGKGDARPGRKMGHITIVGESPEEIQGSLQPLLNAVDQVRAERTGTPKSTIAIKRSGDEKKPTSHQSGRTVAALVAVTMGSDSDLPVLKPGLSLLDDFKIPFEVTITSAHRTPARMFDYARTAASRGIKVIIAAAGGAAHLPGMVAASTPLPVIGVPVKGSTLDGMDSLLSIVQMPRGVPVATVSINNSINAALLAARILGASDVQTRRRVEAYGCEMEQGVSAKVERLEQLGWQEYKAEH